MGILVNYTTDGFRIDSDEVQELDRVRAFIDAHPLGREVRDEEVAPSHGRICARLYVCGDSVSDDLRQAVWDWVTNWMREANREVLRMRTENGLYIGQLPPIPL